MAVEWSTFVYDSCINRCNTTSAPDLCNCDENCYENNTCCPDYVAVCVLGNDIDTTDGITDEYTTEMNEDVMTTLSRVSANPPSSPQTTQKMSTYRVRWTPSTRRPSPPTSSTTPAPRPTITSTSERTTVPPTRRTIPLTTVSKYFLDDMLTIPEEVTTKRNTVFIVEVIPTKEYSVDESEQPVLSDKVFPVHAKPTPTNSATVIAVLAVSCIVISILVLVFLAKRVSCKGWTSIRRMRSGNGDSQSDVRFLTSDEILDFTLARPSEDY